MGDEKLQSLPTYEAPPLIEVAMSVQFAALPPLRARDILRFHETLKDEYPDIEEHPPLEPVRERFPGDPGPGSLQVSFAGVPPPPRYWFVSGRADRLVQLQADRFILNWRKLREPESVYPRFAPLRREFEKRLSQFERFLGEARIEPFTPDSCEITYVNHIARRADAPMYEDLAGVFSVCAAPPRAGLPPDLTAVAFKARHELADAQPPGWLDVIVDSALHREDGPMFVAKLIARGRPREATIESVMSFMDAGRVAIVRGFVGLTTERADRTWRRQA